MENVLITGGTGLVGNKLVEHLKQQEYGVRILSRSKTITNSSSDYYYWNPEKDEIDLDVFKSIDHIIHLAGAGILDKRWTTKRKQTLLDSRVQTSSFLLKMIKDNQIQLKSFISASGVGYYGALTSEKIFKEMDSPHEDFVAEVCKQWEKSADAFSEYGFRTVKLRIGVVLSIEGGALPSLMKPIKMGFGAPIGSGNQYIPWIHISDLSEIFIRALKDDQMSGVYNSVSPDHQTNASLTNAISRTIGKSIRLPNVPSFIIQIMMGERACLILKGSRVSSNKIENTGFKFKFGDIDIALKHLLQN
jgi:uncharacterized protein (TIGR01777 family)